MNKVSRGENLLRMYLKRILPDNRHFYNVRNLDIINPNTNAQLEIDIYIPALKLGFEFQGMQHHYGQQKERDKIKQKICKEKNITLINIWTYSFQKNLYKYLKEKYPQFPFKKPKQTFLTDFQIEADKYIRSISNMNKRLKKVR